MGGWGGVLGVLKRLDGGVGRDGRLGSSEEGEMKCWSKGSVVEVGWWGSVEEEGDWSRVGVEGWEAWGEMENKVAAVGDLLPSYFTRSSLNTGATLVF